MTNSSVVDEETKRGLSRRTLMKGAAWTVPSLMVATAAPAFAASPTQCQPVGTLFNAQSRGRFLTGAILGLDLDTLAQVDGVHAQAFGATANDVQASPLSLTALGALTVDVGGVATALSTVLSFLLGQDAGVLNQYAEAHAAFGGTNTAEVGAAGAVNEANGAITIDESDPAPPALGTISLHSILQNLAGANGVTDLLSYIADLQLDIGAVAGRAWFDSACVTPDEGELTRDYLLAYLRLLVETAVVGDLLSALTTILPTLTVSTDAVWDLLGTIPLLGTLLSTLGKNALTVTASVNVSLLTDRPIPDDPSAALSVNLGKGNVVLDIAALLGGPYAGAISPWLNNLAPNTRLFVDAPLPTNAVATLVDQWVDSLLDRLKDLVFVKVAAGNVTGFLATGLLIEGTLRQFLDGQATATFVLAGVPINLGGLLNGLLGGIGEIVETALDALLNDSALLQTALTGVNLLLAALFDVLSGVLALTVNAQNAATGSMPSYYAAVSPVGRYDVAALHLEAIGFLDVLNLSLARGAVGNNTPRP